MAFAHGDERHWWEAGVNGGGSFWPAKVPDNLNGWVKIFIDAGFELTSNRDAEAGVEKVAIYVDLLDMQPGHVAISDGRCWKSKLGKIQDIEHASLDLLEGDNLWEYGLVERILRRPIKGKRPAKKKAR